MPDTNTKTTKTFAPGDSSPEASTEVVIQKRPYEKPEISITYLQTEHSFVQASGKFSFTGDPNIKDMENGSDITTNHRFDWD